MGPIVSLPKDATNVKRTNCIVFKMAAVSNHLDQQSDDSATHYVYWCITKDVP